MTKASLYVYFGPVAILVCRRFDLLPFWTVAVLTIHLTRVRVRRAVKLTSTKTTFRVLRQTFRPVDQSATRLNESRFVSELSGELML